jgi:hypothetical protein
MPTRRALCIGIDDYPGPESLSGCVNDAKAWRALLREMFQFPDENITLLLDKAATGKNIVSSIGALLAACKKGDAGVVTVSCHGSYLLDDKGLPEGVLCPYDVETTIVPLAELARLTQDVAKGAAITFVIDCGFMGTVTRALILEDSPDRGGADDRRARFLSPALMGKRLASNPWSGEIGSAAWNATVLLACTERQYSYDVYLDGAHRGSFSYAAEQAIRATGGKITPEQLVTKAAAWLERRGFAQQPRLLGRGSKLRKTLFG